MKFDYDLICIGMGPAGMAVSAMASAMGLKVCSIESRQVGGECMNAGCIPSKSLLRMAEARHVFSKLGSMELGATPLPPVKRPFERIQTYIDYIRDRKTRPMFDSVELLLGQGEASFADGHTVEVDGRRMSAKRIFIATGTRPAVPPVEGLDSVSFLTNENVFCIDSVPESMVVIGGGPMGCEMAQAFSRLGCRSVIVHMDPYLLPAGERDAGDLLEASFKDEGIQVYNSRKLTRVAPSAVGLRLETDRGETLEAQKLLVAAGRKYDPSALRLEKAGVEVAANGSLPVNPYLQTNRSHIYAVGDCNGEHLLTHAAMHQGMIALMNAMMPWPFKQDFRKYVVPWTVFTDPEVSHVGLHAAELERRGTSYETVEMDYADYGAAIAEDAAVGFVKVYASRSGRIFGARIVGRGAGEMIGEWALAIQKRVRMHEVMMLQHSFPTMSFLSKRTGDQWMMNRMQSSKLRKLCQTMYRR
jgi:pyruvate/2-oxoglutarate dehydrogenase complex dihydrolipoamide dehydrogenase (E3) component